MAAWGAGKRKADETGRGKALVPLEKIESHICVIRGQRVMLSSDLARLYGVVVRALVQAVERNHARFPADFMFQLTREESRSLRSQFVILDRGRGRYPKYRPYAFTEQGVAMLSSVLRSERAVRVNIGIMRAFVRVREVLGAQRLTARRLAALESRVGGHDRHIQAIFTAIRRLVAPTRRKRRAMGFIGDET